jgi:hypothetical protein
MAFERRKKVAPILQYRWGVVGFLFVLGLSFWYVHTNKELLTRETPPKNVKILCPRCQNEEPARSNCQRCGGKGVMWVGPDTYLPDEAVIVE